MKHVHSLSLSICTILCVEAKAQVYLPSQDLRNRLNSLVPGIVDDNGMMDPMHPGIAGIDTLDLPLTSEGTTVDLTGLEHLSALTWLNVGISHQHVADTLRIPGLPSALSRLRITGDNEIMELGPLPSGMVDFYVQQSAFLGSGSDLLVESFPDHLQSLVLNGLHEMHWSDTARVDDFFWDNPFQGTDLALPPIAASSTTIRVYCTSLDISRLETPDLFLNELFALGGITWPLHIQRLTCDMVQFATSSGWPNQLDTLSIMSYMDCIPYLPNSLSSLYIAFPFPGSCLPNWPTSLPFYSLGPGSAGMVITEEEAVYCSVLNSECPGAYPALAGVVRMDLNNNGTVDADEPIVPSSTVTIAPGGQSTGCLADGSWQIGVPPGEHTITAASGYPYVVSMSPASQAGSVPAMGDVDLNNDFAVAVQPDIQDLRVHVYADPARPGFDNQVHLHCENYGTTPVDAELNLVFDADQTWLSSSVAPTSTSSNTAMWNFPAMPIGTVQHIVVELNTAASVPLGTDITHTLTAGPITTDETPSDNTYTFNDSVVGSYDPNDKLLSPALLTPTEVTLGETPIEYTIRFQNTGTYLAERVVILDTLSNDLQWESMRFIASSHDQHWYIVDGVLHVVYNEIMLPDSNTNEAASHGFFKFSMLPKTDLVNGSNIENIAHIVFDFNAPIITPPAVFTVDIGAGVEAGSTTTELRILPNPAHDRIQVKCDRILSYRIHDLLGQTVRNGIVEPGTWLDVSALPAGSYILETISASEHTSDRFVKH